MAKNRAPIKVRSVWISDVHLGFRGCQAETLLHFLHSVETDYLFLVGDIVDFWSIKKNPYWPQEHTNVIRSILGKAKHGTKVIYVPGNHDEALRDCAGHIFGNLEIHLDYVHTTADGRKLLIMHGDEFDVIVKHSRLIARLGNAAYDFLLWLNRYVNGMRKFFGYSYWSLAAYLKLKVKNAVSFISSFENALARMAKDRGVDGVVCGHIHHAEIREIDSILYCNDGDWVESCTTLLEHQDGSLELINWTDKFEQHKNVEGMIAAKKAA
ncbi:UDP-2,3-diacylglucosamine diphosphatase [Nitrosomonas marina]|uniref:UDP-2,3-diacylglucosamine pyrophosphatase LpxH n=1 Tax=Nitrosomonas marina TaxID=917 RepID=A0A1H8BBG8_9PROT|nr:UDP-2,3-diacylglucosamine diphosphatase [Nitrosomonas marina]SEM80290.1 UDP-2,3-diacylglucosamine pyrophosphatase LpxH [Nitrosomonas marina]